MSQLSKNDLKAENQTEFPNNNVGAIAPSNLRAFNVDMIDSTVNQTIFDSFSGSVASQFAAATGSVTSAITASSLITASFASQTMTFTKGDGSTFGVYIPDQSGSTGNFATTGSNTFNGNQTINGNLDVSNTISGSGAIYGQTLSIPDSIFGGNIRFLSGSGGSDFYNIQLVPGAGDIAFSRNGASNTKTFTLAGSAGANTTFQNNPVQFLGTVSSVQFNQPIQIQNGINTNVEITGSLNVSNIAQSNIAGTGSNTFTGNQTISGNVDIQNALSASLPQGYVWVGDASNRTVVAATSSFGGGSSINTGSFATTGSNNFFGSQTIITTASVIVAADNGISIGPTNGLGTNLAVGAIKLQAHSGSLVLSNNSFTNNTASLSHISASDNTLLANFIFKPNNNVGTTIISGSGNMFINPTIPATGRINYIGGSSNLFLNAQSQQLPTITGSAASVSGNRPTMNANFIAGPHVWSINQSLNPGTHTYSNNLINGGGTTTFNMLGNTGIVTYQNNILTNPSLTINSPSRSIAEINAGASGSNALTIQNNVSLAGAITYNGPVSSSTHTIGANALIGGGITANAQSGSRAIGVQQNSIQGNLVLNDNTVFAPNLGSQHTISGNAIVGAATFTNRASASFQANNNFLNGVTISNDWDASGITTTATRLLSVNGNQIFGIGHNIYASGSQGAVANRRGALYNLIGGDFHSASLVGDGESKSMFSTTILGTGLNVYGTSQIYTGLSAQNYGSAFFGRWNAEDGNRAKTAETIFAIGTGTSGSAGIVRKTGFLIDSGSNSYFEGTLNVSGSSTLSGSLYIQNAATLPSQTGSAVITYNPTTGQIGQSTYSGLLSASFNVGAFSSLVTQSGSANVSQSIQFDTTDYSSGITLQSGSQMLVKNAGVYSLTFSAQCDPITGAGDLYIWLKKNGSNVANTATKLSLANNDSQLMTVNFVLNTAANDYYELAWQSDSGDIILEASAATGNIPAIPSVIVTITQVR